MLDRYFWGSVTRISPEAPVPVVALEETSLRAGGAANVAANIYALGAIPFLLGVIGADSDGEELMDVLGTEGLNTGMILRSGSRKTTIKTRVVAHGQHVVRVDSETRTPLDDTDTKDLLRTFTAILDDVDAVVLSDYDKGTFTPRIVRSIIDASRKAGKPVLIDPKGKDYSKYRGATLLTPNRKEAAEAAHLAEHLPELVSRSGAILLQDIDVEHVLITESENGMTLFSKDSSKVHFDAHSKEVFDVTGAGDAVIGCFSVAIAAGFSFIKAAQLSNIAGGISVQRIGTSPVSIADLKLHLSKLPASEAVTR